MKISFGPIILTAIVFSLLITAFGCRFGGSGGVLQSGWSQVETFQFDWNGDGVLDTFYLENPSDVQEPGSFKRIRIDLSGQPEFTLENEDFWIRFGSGVNEGSGSFAQQNMASSQYVLFLPLSNGDQKRSLLFLTGIPAGNTPGRLQVLQIDDDGSPRVIFYRDEFDLEDYVDLNGDGYPEMVGKSCFEKRTDDGLETYAPFQAFEVPRDIGGKVILSMGMSATYNRLHYYGWAGPDCSDDLVILKNPPAGGKPLIMKASDAAKFTQAKPDKDSDKESDKKTDQN